MKKTLTAIALVLGLAAGHAAHAQTTITNNSTGWQLDTWCQQNAMECGDYLAGVFGGYAETMKIQKVLHPELGIKQAVCLGGTVSGEQLRQVYLAYADTHASSLTYPAPQEAIISILHAYPCEGFGGLS
jgi:hypothetical protein